MNIDIDSNFNAKDIEELNSQLNDVFSKLFATLQRQPNFYLDIDPSTPVPSNLPASTIVFQLTANNTLKLGIYNGEHVNTSI